MFQQITIPSSCGHLACQVAGVGEPLVLLHGGAGSWTHWIRNIEPLSSRWHVYAVDLPGCGDSPDVPSSIGAGDYVALVADALEGYEAFARHFAMAGFSFGGAVAAGVAARPSTPVSALALLGPGGFGKPAGRSLDLQKVPFGGAEDLISKALRHNLREMMFADPSNIDADTVALHRHNVIRARFDSRIVSLGENLLNDLSTIDCPVFVGWGAQDSLAYPSVEDRALSCRTHGRDLTVQTFPNAGHWVQYEAAEAVNAALLDFFDPTFSTRLSEAKSWATNRFL